MKYTIISLAGVLLSIISVLAQEVPVLLTAKYNQKAPYNASCPDGAVTGCGPTAVAEILNLYKLPAHGYEEAQLVIGEDTTYVDMKSILFNWDEILDSYTEGAYTEAEAKSVADLMYACGVAMHVSYGSSTSVTNYAKMLYGMQHNLHISPDSRYLHRKNYSTAEWIELLNEQLRNGHPVFYRGTWFFYDDRSDHIFVVDGLDQNGYYHVNFGHGGKDDKFCDINVLNQTGSYPGGKGVCYNASQVMVINCFPTPEYTDYPLQASVSEEAVILNGDINLSRINLPLDESFTLSCRLRNCSMEKVSVTFGWALIKDGEILDILGQGRYGLSPGYTFKEASHRTVKLPADLTDGEYTLELYSKSNLEATWKEVWQDAVSVVDVKVKNGRATITVPPNHRLDPGLFLAETIREVDNEFAATAPGRTFAMTINNNTINNFEHTIRLEIIADGEEYIYELTIPVYSQTTTEFHVLVPSCIADLQDKNITSLKAFYYYDIEDRYIEMTTDDPYAGVNLKELEEIIGDVSVYDMSGVLLRVIRADEITAVYNDFLRTLPHGVYVVKEGNRTRKIIR
ncbi:MAG: C10 family peptidase [Muribaculaceae bacterium]|nr:C10 family peptidase [Muribaculaceae bacterium]